MTRDDSFKTIHSETDINTIATRVLTITVPLYCRFKDGHCLTATPSRYSGERLVARVHFCLRQCRREHVANTICPQSEHQVAFICDVTIVDTNAVTQTHPPKAFLRRMSPRILSSGYWMLHNRVTEALRLSEKSRGPRKTANL